MNQLKRRLSDRNLYQNGEEHVGAIQQRTIRLRTTEFTRASHRNVLVHLYLNLKILKGELPGKGTSCFLRSLQMDFKLARCAFVLIF